jgi:hypothetical protein
MAGISLTASESTTSPSSQSIVTLFDTTTYAFLPPVTRLAQPWGLAIALPISARAPLPRTTQKIPPTAPLVLTPDIADQHALNSRPAGRP